VGFGKTLVLYLATFGVFFIIDLIWLGIMNGRFYKKELSALMAEKVKWLPAIIFYLLFVFAALVLVILPALDKGSWLNALLYGALLGMISYGTYDFTNLASIRDWPLKNHVRRYNLGNRAIGLCFDDRVFHRYSHRIKRLLNDRIFRQVL
jgi:uncharacterized membrane protein